MCLRFLKESVLKFWTAMCMCIHTSTYLCLPVIHMCAYEKGIHLIYLLITCPFNYNNYYHRLEKKGTVSHAEGCLLYTWEIILRHVSAEMFPRKVIHILKCIKKNCRTLRCSNLNGISFLQLIIVY